MLSPFQNGEPTARNGSTFIACKTHLIELGRKTKLPLFRPKITAVSVVVIHSEKFL